MSSAANSQESGRSSLLLLRNRISSALCDNGDKARADEALMALWGRAERYEAALRLIATIPVNVASIPSATEISDEALDE